jgi:hypothetical protein
MKRLDAEICLTGHEIDNVRASKDNGFLECGVLDASTYQDDGDTESFFLKRNADSPYFGSVIFSKNRMWAKIQTSHGNHRQVRTITAAGVEILVELPDVPVDSEADQGFMRDDEWEPRDPVRINCEGDYSHELAMVGKYVDAAKTGEDQMVSLPHLLIREKK